MKRSTRQARHPRTIQRVSILIASGSAMQTGAIADVIGPVGLVRPAQPGGFLRRASRYRSRGPWRQGRRSAGKSSVQRWLFWHRQDCDEAVESDEGDEADDEPRDWRFHGFSRSADCRDLLLSANTTGASSMTRASLTIVPISSAR
jgi:hypothetical protein